MDEALVEVLAIGVAFLRDLPDETVAEAGERAIEIIDEHPQLRHGESFVEIGRLHEEHSQDPSGDTMAWILISTLSAANELLRRTQLHNQTSRHPRTPYVPEGTIDLITRALGREPLPDSLEPVLPFLCGQWRLNTQEQSPAITAFHNYQGGTPSPLEFRGLVELVLAAAEQDDRVPISEQIAERAARKALKGPTMLERLGGFVGKRYGLDPPPYFDLYARALDRYLKHYGHEIE